MSAAGHQWKRMKRAESEHMMLRIVGPDSFTVTGDSGNSHVIDTVGTEAVHCTCPDYEHNCSGQEKCKHMIAYEEWEVDEVVV
jgi:predicted nucleic acid-binding Zn finger protein